MTNNIVSNILIVLGIVMIISGFFNLINYDNINEEGIQKAKLAEERYMMEHYGYRDNMEDYLDYLKDNDIDAFMKLKPVWEDMQYDNSENSWIMYLSFPLVIAGFFIGLIALPLRE